MEVLPELNSLEGDTLDMLLVQAETHVRYEKAARQLVQQVTSARARLCECVRPPFRLAHSFSFIPTYQERAKLEEEHAREIRGLRQQNENEVARSLDARPTPSLDLDLADHLSLSQAQILSRWKSHAHVVSPSPSPHRRHAPM